MCKHNYFKNNVSFVDFLKVYQDFVSNKNKAAISVDGAAVDEVDSCVPAKSPSEVPNGFYGLQYLAMKYLVVKAPRNGKDVFMITFLVSAGASGLEATAIAKKSRKDLDKERR